MTTVAIVEDNNIVRQTLRDWIDGAPGYKCVCGCATTKEALVEIPAHRPNVVLMDINLPGGESGITCTAQLKQLLRRLRLFIKTLQSRRSFARHY
jgi:DNA-binding NarL/FixJ family response regulator